MMLSSVSLCMHAHQFIWLCTNGGNKGPRLSVLDADGKHTRAALRWQDEAYINTTLQRLGQPVVQHHDCRLPQRESCHLLVWRAFVQEASMTVSAHGTLVWNASGDILHGRRTATRSRLSTFGFQLILCKLTADGGRDMKRHESTRVFAFFGQFSTFLNRRWVNYCCRTVDAFARLVTGATWKEFVR